MRLEIPTLTMRSYPAAQSNGYSEKNWNPEDRFARCDRSVSSGKRWIYYAPAGTGTETLAQPGRQVGNLLSVIQECERERRRRRPHEASENGNKP